MESPQYTAGERAFIASIINQAIADGESFRNPRPPHERIRRVDRLKQHRQRIVLVAFHMIFENEFRPRKRKTRKPFPWVYYFGLLHATVIKISESEVHSWTGRESLKCSNPTFVILCDLLDIDPEYLEERARDHFARFDQKKTRKKSEKRTKINY